MNHLSVNVGLYSLPYEVFRKVVSYVPREGFKKNPTYCEVLKTYCKRLTGIPVLAVGVGGIAGSYFVGAMAVAKRVEAAEQVATPLGRCWWGSISGGSAGAIMSCMRGNNSEDMGQAIILGMIAGAIASLDRSFVA